ncbi:hypothetical protein [Streptomyces sp. NPDC093598]|uniref:hypothetical protein n=1 Tax=Streptomyces sp. NPDC093598 TaxID=3366046 RepID=UPI003823683F
MVVLAGDTEIAGVPGTAARRQSNSPREGKLLPTGNMVFIGLAAVRGSRRVGGDSTGRVLTGAP